MSSETIYKCDGCHKETAYNDLENISIMEHTILAREPESLAGGDLCADCLAKLIAVFTGEEQ